MHLSLSLVNVLHQTLSDTINTIVEPSATIFDHIMFLVNPKYNFYAIYPDDIKYNTDNAKSLIPSYVDLYGYNLYISQNPMSYVKNNLSQIFHINSLLIFHTYKPNNLKKEDRAIINSKIHKQTKIFFDANQLKDWQIQNKTMVMPYGVPLNHISYSIQCSDRTKDVLIVGDNQNVVNRALHRAFTDNNYSCDISGLHLPNIAEANTVLNRYKIVIDLNNNGLINCLCAVAAGCYAIHSTQRTSTTESAIFASSPENIIASTQQLLQEYNAVDHLNRIQNDRLSLRNNYNFELFQNNMSNVIEHLSHQEVFTI